MAVPLEHKQVTIDSVTWTALAPPFACNNVRIVNQNLTNAVKIRTTDTSALTEVTLPSGQAYPLEFPRSVNDQVRSLPYRFLAGTTLAFAQAVSGTGPVMLICCV